MLQLRVSILPVLYLRHGGREPFYANYIILHDDISDDEHYLIKTMIMQIDISTTVSMLTPSSTLFVHGRWKIRKKNKKKQKVKESFRSKRSHIEKGESPSKASRVTLDHFTLRQERGEELPAAINSFTCERLRIKKKKKRNYLRKDPSPSKVRTYRHAVRTFFSLLFLSSLSLSLFSRQVFNVFLYFVKNVRYFTPSPPPTLFVVSYLAKRIHIYI